MSPFGSGKPLTEESPQKTAFQMPNTEWKTRTLSGITYEFGKGNPKEVALDANQLNAYSLCKAPFLDPSYGNIEGQCAEGRGYVTPEVEEYLLLALSDPNWSKLATECEKNFRVVENNDTLINGQNDPSFPYFDRVFASGFLNIDHFISIDPSTGLKILNVGLTQSLPLFLSTASHYGTRKEDGFVNPYGDCVDQYGSEIARNILLAFSIYKDSLDHIQGYTNKYLLSKDFTLSDY